MDDVTIRLRVHYAKAGRLRFLSHLELIATLERIVRRSGLPFAVTQGFSPRMKLAFNLPLPVGIAGENEFFDVWLTSFVDTNEACMSLRKAAPASIVVHDVSYVPSQRPSLSAYYTNSAYRLDFVFNNHEGVFKELANILAKYREEGSLSFEKKGKEKILFFDDVFFREPHILKTDEGTYELMLYLKPSDAGSLRPELFFTNYQERAAGEGYNITLQCITRTEQFPSTS